MANLRMNISKWDMMQNFKPLEFACPCGKCKNDGSNMSYDLLRIVQDIRDLLGKPIEVTRGQSCQEYNDSLEGSIKNSDHLSGDAVDITSPFFKDKNARFIIMRYIMRYTAVKYCYCDGYLMEGSITKTYNAAWMVHSIHISVRR